MPRYQFLPNMGRHSIIDPKTGARRHLEVGEVITCRPDEIKSFAHKFRCLDPKEEERERNLPVLEDPRTGLQIVARSGAAGWFDIINPATNRPINDNALRLDDAKALVKETGQDVETSKHTPTDVPPGSEADE